MPRWTRAIAAGGEPGEVLRLAPAVRAAGIGAGRQDQVDALDRRGHVAAARVLHRDEARARRRSRNRRAWASICCSAASSELLEERELERLQRDLVAGGGHPPQHVGRRAVEARRAGRPRAGARGGVGDVLENLLVRPHAFKSDRVPEPEGLDPFRGEPRGRQRPAQSRSPRRRPRTPASSSSSSVSPQKNCDELKANTRCERSRSRFLRRRRALPGERRAGPIDRPVAWAYMRRPGTARGRTRDRAPLPARRDERPQPRGVSPAGRDLSRHRRPGRLAHARPRAARGRVAGDDPQRDAGPRATSACSTARTSAPAGSRPSSGCGCSSTASSRSATCRAPSAPRSSARSAATSATSAASSTAPATCCPG